MTASFFMMECGKGFDFQWNSDPLLDLPLAVDDLVKFYQFVTQRFPNKNVDLVSTDLDFCKEDGLIFGVRSNINAALRRFCERSKTSEMRVFYYAGHGVVDDGELYLVPADFRRDDVRNTGISLSSVLQNLNGLQGQNFVFLDCCRQSARIEAMPTMMPFSVRLSERTHIFLGCSDGEASHETSDATVNGGIFTHAFLNAWSECTPATTMAEFFKCIQRDQGEMVSEMIRDRTQVPRLWTLSPYNYSMGALLDKLAAGPPQKEV